MTTKRVLLALIVLTGGLFVVFEALAQDYVLALIALGLAVAWLVHEIKDQPVLPSLYFVALAMVAVWGRLHGLPILVILAGFCFDLAAWDLSRFRARTADSLDHAPVLEAAHLRTVAVTVGAGFLLALIPVLIRLPIQVNFVIFCLLVVLALLVLRRSALSLRG